MMCGVTSDNDLLRGLKPRTRRSWTRYLINGTRCLHSNNFDHVRPLIHAKLTMTAKLLSGVLNVSKGMYEIIP